MIEEILQWREVEGSKPPGYQCQAYLEPILYRTELGRRGAAAVVDGDFADRIALLSYLSK